MIHGGFEPMVVIDHDGIILPVNPAFEQLLDRTAARLVGAHFGYPHAPDRTIDIEPLTGQAPRVATMRVADIDRHGTPAFLRHRYEAAPRREPFRSTAHGQRSADSRWTCSSDTPACRI